MPRLDVERRRGNRYSIAAPVQFPDDSEGRTLDMSTSGVFLEATTASVVGESVSFSVLLQDSTVQCEGKVVRVESLNGAFRIAIELVQYTFIC